MPRATKLPSWEMPLCIIIPKPMPVRDVNGVTRAPYAPMCARAIFVLQDESNKPILDDVIGRLSRATDLRTQAEDYFTQKILTAQERDVFVRRLDQGVRTESKLA